MTEDPAAHDNDEATSALVPAEEVRPLGVIERAFEIFNEEGLMTPVIACQVGGQIDPAHLQAAVEQVHARHPMMQMRILPNEGGEGYAFHRGGRSPTVRVTTEPHSLWPGAADEAVHRSYDSARGPLWSADLVRFDDAPECCALVFAFHHAIEDGGTASRVLHDVLTRLRALHRGEDPPPVQPQEPLPPVEALTGARLSLGRKLSVIGRGLFRALIARPKLPLDDPEAPFPSRRTRMICRALDPAASRALVKACRAHETTVHGALCAAMLMATGPYAPKGLPTRLQLDSSLSLRPYCDPPVSDEMVGLYFSTVSWVFTVRERSDFWTLAREARRRVKQRIDKGDAVHNPLLLDWIPPDGLRAHMKDAPGRQQALFISNMGRYGYSDEEDLFPLESYYCASGQHGSGACLWLGVVTVAGSLNCSFAWVEPQLKESTAEAMSERVMELLREAPGAKLLPESSGG